MNLRSRIVNRSYTTIGCEQLLSAGGADVLTVIAKLTLTFDATGRVALGARAVRTRDEPDGCGGVSLPSDVADAMPGTSLGLSGTLSLVPRDVESAVVSLRMGSLAKSVRVFGERVYVARGSEVEAGDARALTPTRLVPSLAWGGRDKASEPAAVALANPVGRGFARDPRRLVGQPAHRLEHVSTGPVDELRRAQAFFAPIPAMWEPRVARAGTYDDAWRRRRRPVPPIDRDPRFACWASADLHSEEPLRGDEAIEISGLSAAPFRLALPRYGVRMASRVRGREHEHEVHLDGVLVDWDERAVELTWRASVALPRTWELLERVVVEATHTLPDPVIDPSSQETPS